MLEKVEFKNFRCFKNFEIEFDNFSIIVGINNSGKSTIIDALKLISNVRRFAPYRNYFKIKNEDAYGCLIEERDIPFSKINLRYNYIEKDSIITSKFSDGTEIKIVFPVNNNPYAYFLKDGTNIHTSRSLRKYFEHSIGVIPPAGTFEETEDLGVEKYIRTVMISHLSPRHFRNIWYYFNDGFDEFKEIIEKTWPKCTIEPPELDKYSGNISMFFREVNITREIFWAGHGFQVWLQLMTFLVKLGHKDTLILDEPDIFLHSDMQKKLVNICKERSNQVIIATHAVDIIEEVEPDDIISIDKNFNKASKLSNIDEVQTCITQLGSFQNLKLIHFIRGKTCLFVEGNDFHFLKILSRKLNINSFAREDGFSVVPLDGFSNWDRLLHIEWLFKNAFGEIVKCYVILDRDYNTDEEISQIDSNLTKKGVVIHIWERKEIENYFINFDVLYRMFINKFSKRHKDAEIPLSSAEFSEKLILITDELKNGAQSQIIAKRVRNREKSIDESTIISQAMIEFEDNWKDKDNRIKIISGKEFFSKLNTWLNSTYNISISVGYAINSLKADEIEPEIHDVINKFIELVNS